MTLERSVVAEKEGDAAPHAPRAELVDVDYSEIQLPVAIEVGLNLPSDPQPNDISLLQIPEPGY